MTIDQPAPGLGVWGHVQMASVGHEAVTRVTLRHVASSSHEGRAYLHDAPDHGVTFTAYKGLEWISIIY